MTVHRPSRLTAGSRALSPEAPRLDDAVAVHTGETRPMAGRLAATLGTALHALRRLGKAMLIATGLSLLTCSPTMITHLPTALLAPITAGYTTGGILKLNGTEALGLSLAFLLLIGLPLPIVHARYGVLGTLGTPTVVFFSVVAAVYYAVLVGAFAWIGGGGLSDAAA